LLNIGKGLQVIQAFPNKMSLIQLSYLDMFSVSLVDAVDIKYKIMERTGRVMARYTTVLLSIKLAKAWRESSFM
jgi:hypothetical protein